MQITSTTLPMQDQGSPTYTDLEKIERAALGLPACEPAPSGLIKRLPNDRVIEAIAILVHPEAT